MGVDLTLLPVRYPQLTPFRTYTRLSLQIRRYELWERLKERASLLNEKIKWYDDDGIEECTEDAYGDPLHFLTACQLFREFAALPGSDICEWDKAVIAFVGALPPETHIILWFH